VAVLIDCPPQTVMLSLDRQIHLIHVLLVTKPRTATTELIGILLPEFASPLMDRLIRHDHATFSQELFDIAQAQTELKIQPYRMADDFSGKPMVLVACGGAYGTHTATLSHRRGVKQVVNATARSALRRADPPCLAKLSLAPSLPPVR
jgi:hypothetical protein